MKGTGKIILVVFFGMILMLAYVHEQFLLFQVSYDIDKKSNYQAVQAENYRHLKYQVDQLKAPRQLEEKIQKHSLELTFPKEIRVVKIPVQTTLKITTVPDVPIQTLTGQFTHFFGRWIDVAQAKTDNS